MYIASKRLLAFLMVGILTLLTGAGARVCNLNSSLHLEEQMTLQADAVYANENLMDSFEKGEFGECIFPDDFCGCWIEGAQLMLALTNTDDETVGQYRDRIGDCFHCVRVVYGKYAYNYLYSLGEDISEEIKRDYEGAFECFYVHESTNTVCIGVKKEFYSEIASAYTSQPISIVESEEDTEELTGLQGGWSIYDATNTSGYTLGVCGRKANVDSFVTAGHGVSVGDSFKLSPLSSVIGTVSFLRYSNNNYGDFSIVSISNTTDYYQTSAIGSYTVTGYLANPAEGTILRFLGSSTNGNGYGVVTGRNLVLSYDTITLKGMTSLLASSGGTVAGDSGCAYFYNPSGTYSASYCGVHRGHKYIDGYLQQIFTPYQYLSYVGFDLDYDE